MRRVRLAATVAVALAAGVVVSAAAADPSGSKNNFTFPATCDGATVMLVVNSANGQGNGAQDQDTAPFAPAHVLGTNQVFHPTKFDLTFTSMSGGQTFSFVDTDTKRNAKTPTECSIDYSITDPDTGDTFALAGNVWGFFS